MFGFSTVGRGSSAATKLSAISDVQGWMEFATSGHIMAVSDRLCDTLGYSRQEMIGQHHRSLCDAEDATTREYDEFWNRLRAGTQDSGVYRLKRKDGQEVWLQASFKPIRRFGRVTRIIKFAIDVTAEHQRVAATASRMAAMNNSQAIIEFSLDGTVVQANENFLHAMGYQATEVVGKHHRVFCQPDYAASTEYPAFWRRLGSGETFTGRYPRVRKDGTVIWIQGSYNPLRDTRGRVVGVVKACIDVTAQVESERALQSLVREAGRVLDGMANGDLTGRVQGEYDGELGQLASSLNRTAQSLVATLSDVSAIAGSMKQAVAQLAEGTIDLSDRTSAQVSALEETAAAMEEMTASVQQNAEHAKAADDVGRRTRLAAQRSGHLMADALNAMSAITESGKRIGAITRVIDDLAFQTNLLSLNAAVEAARAGDHGRGFAVVAEEVRSLALRSATAAKEISALIEETMGRVTDGGRLVGETSSALNSIVTEVEEVTNFIARISTAAQEQSAGIQQVNASVSKMDGVNQQNAALAEELSAASQALDQQSVTLRTQVAAFVLEHRTETASRTGNRAVKSARRTTRAWTPAQESDSSIFATF